MMGDAARAQAPHRPRLRRLDVAPNRTSTGHLKGYAFTISIILLATTLITLAVFSSNWRRTQEYASSNIAIPSDGLRMEDRVAGDLGRLLGVQAELRKNSSAMAVAAKLSFPFRKEGLPLADISGYALSLPSLLSGSIPYEVALAPNFIPSSDPLAITIPNVGFVKVSNNGSNGTDTAIYSFAPGLNPAGISVSFSCDKSRTIFSQLNSSQTGPVSVSVLYNDSDGQGIYNSTTSGLSSNSSFLVAYADGTNLSLSINLSSTAYSNITISYTKSPLAALILTFDSNSTNATGGVPDYSPFGRNMTLGGGNSSKAPAWSNMVCHSHGCYSFNGTDGFISGPNLNFAESPPPYSETTYGLNGGFENNSSANTFYNWVPVGNTTANDFAQASDAHAGIRALSANSANTSAYIYNDKAILLSDTLYSLEFWAKQATPRFAIYDVSGNQYLGLNGSWQSALELHNASAGASYAKTVKNFRTRQTSVSSVAIRFYAPSNTTQTAKIDDVSLTKVSDFSFSFWARSSALNGSALYQIGSQGRFGATGFDFSTAGGNMTANLTSDGTSVVQGANITGSQWHHIALTVNRTGNTTLYLDGSLVSTSNFPVGTLNSSPNFTIGARNSTAGFFTGALDEIRIYSRALLPSEILSHYYNRYQSPCSANITVVYTNASLVNSTTTAYYNAALAIRSLVPGTVLYMPFDGNITSNQSGAILDYSGYANSGTLGGGNSSRVPNWTSNGSSSGAYSFDGAWGYAEAPFSQSINLTQNVSLMAWLYMLSPSNTAHGAGIISKGNGMNNGQYELIINGNGRPQFRGTAQNTQFEAFCTTNLSALLNTWHFVAATFNGSHVNCYTDGYADGTTNIIGLAMPLVSTSDSLAIGVRHVHRDSQGLSHLNGTIDEVRIYGRVLSSEEIDSIYRDTILIRKGPLVASAD